MNALKDVVGRLLRHIGAAISRRLVIANYAEYCSTKPKGRALVSYLVLPLLPPHAFRDRTMFSNRGIAQLLPEVLNEMGYSVDIINYNNSAWKPRREYDLFIGHGGINFERIASHLNKSGVKIYFSTGLYWREANVREAKRIYDLAVRRGYLLKPGRSIKADEEYANQAADGIICLGNARVVRSYSHFPRVIGINNATYPVSWTGWKDKDYAAGREHFLFFSGRGNIHKGLDILLEAFIQTSLHLHVCQWIEPDFANAYRSELYHQPNIHLHGFVRMRSPAFESLAEQCNWVILPTCGEGQPGSVIECMAHGLVPVLPDGANIDLEDWGIRLKEVSVEYLAETARHLSQMNADECFQRAHFVMEAVRRSYMPSNFKANLRKAIENIMSADQGTESHAASELPVPSSTSK